MTIARQGLKVEDHTPEVRVGIGMDENTVGLTSILDRDQLIGLF